MYDLGNWALMFASISGQVAPAFSLSNYFGLHLLLLLKLHQILSVDSHESN